LNSEPVLWGLTPAIVTGVITSAINLGNTFGLIAVTGDQLDALNAFAVQLMTLLGVLGAVWARNRVTPV
jgi:uncharacterized membrane protein